MRFTNEYVTSLHVVLLYIYVLANSGVYVQYTSLYWKEQYRSVHTTFGQPCATTQSILRKFPETCGIIRQLSHPHPHHEKVGKDGMRKKVGEKVGFLIHQRSHPHSQALPYGRLRLRCPMDQGKKHPIRVKIHAPFLYFQPHPSKPITSYCVAQIVLGRSPRSATP